MWEEKSNLHLRELARRSQREWDCENEEEEKKFFSLKSLKINPLTEENLVKKAAKRKIPIATS